MQKQIKKTWFFKHSPEEVWDYLTRPELLELWLMKNDIKPVVGHKFRFTFIESDKNQYAGIVHCEVLEVIPYSKLSYSWNGSTRDKKRTFSSTVTWSLIPVNNGTELHLTHDGFDVPEDLLAHTAGWDSCLNKLESSINSPN